MSEAHGYDRLTHRARRALGMARSLAMRFGCERVELEHLLLAILRESDGVVDRALGNIVQERLGPPGAPGAVSEVVLSQDVKDALSYSLDEAVSLLREGTSDLHLLLGVMRVATETSHELLAEFSVELDTMRKGASLDSPEVESRPTGTVAASPKPLESSAAIETQLLGILEQLQYIRVRLSRLESRADRE